MHSLSLICEMLTSGFADNILNILAILAIYLGISVIINSNPVISILYLIGLIASIGIYLISEGFTFLGLSYLIIYIGAVSILFLFILMLIDIRLSEVQSNTSNSIPLTLIIGIYFCYYLLQFLPYNIAIIGGGTNLTGALNLKLFNLLNEVTVTAEQGKELLVEGYFVRTSANSTEKTVAGKTNSFDTDSDRYHYEFNKVSSGIGAHRASSTDDSPLAEINELAAAHNQESSGAKLLNTFNIDEYITHSVGSPKNNHVTNVRSNA